MVILLQTQLANRTYDSGIYIFYHMLPVQIALFFSCFRNYDLSKHVILNSFLQFTAFSKTK